MTAPPSLPAAPAWGERRSGPAPDGGFTLVELLISLSLILVVMGGFFSLFFALTGAANTVGVSTRLQENTRNVVRVLEADVRSADPLTLVPSSFPNDPTGTSNAGPNGTSPTDVIAMYEVSDRYSPCRTTSTVPAVQSPFQILPVAANLVWAFDPVARSLTRYSYCANSGWTAGMSLPDVVDAGATMFRAAQDTNATPLAQQPLPTSTVVANQSTPVCGVSLAVVVSVKPPRQANSFTVRASLPLENQNFVQVQEAC